MRSLLVNAFVVLRGTAPDPTMARTLQGVVKAEIAPHKYSRSVPFTNVLPRTETDKQRQFRLRDGG